AMAPRPGAMVAYDGRGESRRLPRSGYMQCRAVLLEFTLEEKGLCDSLFARANRMPADALPAVDVEEGNMREKIEVGYQTFVSDGGAGFGAVRGVSTAGTALEWG